MMKRILMAVVFAACTIPAFALPTVEAVRDELAKGHDVQAEQMIREVLVARPESARARYVHAEILAHQGQFAQAAAEAAQARHLDPGLSFTQPQTFQAFEAMLAREQSAAAGMRAPATAPHTLAAVDAGRSRPPGGLPGWTWGIGIALLAVWALRRMTSAGRQPSAPGMPVMASVYPTAPAGVGAATMPYGVAQPTPSGASGSGLLGTGLAVAGGVAAGMLADRLIEGHREAASSTPWTAAPSAMAFEPFDDAATEASAARELEQRPIDMGQGEDWGGADADAPSSDSTDGW